MARIKNGILDGFSGKVGTVVGSSWRGINYMRAKSVRRKTTLTDKQKATHLKFTLMLKFLQTVKDLVNLGYSQHALRMTEANSALSYNLKNAITGNYPDFSIVFPEALITRGDLPNAKVPVATAGPAGTINFNWTDNSGTGKAKETDKAILIAYSEAEKKAAYVIAPLRSAGNGTLAVPGFSGQTAQTWISFVTDDGKDIATSVFAGVVNVL